MNPLHHEHLPIEFRSAFIHNDAIQATSTFLQNPGVNVERDGAHTKAFEKNVAELTQSRFALTTSSCTAALHLALLAANIGPGDEVISCPLTYVSQNLAIHYTGANIVFADILKKI